MNATVMCEKCGKPLGVFNGKICYECEKKAHADFKRYCTENNYVPLTTEMYSRAIKAMDALDKIREELVEDYESYSASEVNFDFACGIKRAIDTIDYHINHKAERSDKE